MLGRYSVSLLLTLWMFAFIANATDVVDLRTWSQRGAASSGNWTVSEDGKSVYQSINGNSTFFISNVDYSYRVFRGYISVDAGAGDDDYIGYAFSVTPDSFYIFDWRKAPVHNHTEGFYLIKVNTPIDSIPTDWLMHEKETSFSQLIAHTKGFGGWSHGIRYPFQIELTPNKVKILVNNQVIFDLEGEYPAGKFGFYNLSQGKVRYEAIEQMYPPKPDDKTTSAFQGVSKTISGTYTDENRYETHTCKLKAQPKFGFVEQNGHCDFIFSPDPDTDVDTSFRYIVTDNSGLSAEGIVNVQIAPSGASPIVPEYVRVGDNVVMPLRLSGDQNKSEIEVIKLPHWLSFDGDSFVGNPSQNDIGQYEIEFSSESNGYSHKFGPFTLKVLPVKHTLTSDNVHVTLPHNEVLYTQEDLSVTNLVIPPLTTENHNIALGSQTGTFSVDDTSLYPISIDGHIVNPGESYSFQVDLGEKGAVIPLKTVSTVEGESKYNFIIEDLKSTLDPYPITQIACGAHDSSNCQPTLRYSDKTLVEVSEVQLLHLTNDDEVTAYSIDSINQLSLLVTVISQYKSDSDTLAINLNGMSALSNQVLNIINAEYKTNLHYYENGSGLVTISKGNAEYARTEPDYRYGIYTTEYY